MLHLRPDLVDLAAGFRNVPEPLAAEPPRALRRHGVVRLAVQRLRPLGLIGDPTGATAERGKLLFEARCTASERRWPKSPRSTSARSPQLDSVAFELTR